MPPSAAVKDLRVEDLYLSRTAAAAWHGQVCGPEGVSCRCTSRPMGVQAWEARPTPEARLVPPVFSCPSGSSRWGPEWPDGAVEDPPCLRRPVRERGDGICYWAGSDVGFPVGWDAGAPVGRSVGFPVGCELGPAVGCADGPWLEAVPARLAQKVATLSLPPAAVIKAVKAGLSRALPALVLTPAV